MRAFFHDEKFCIVVLFHSFLVNTKEYTHLMYCRQYLLKTMMSSDKLMKIISPSPFEGELECAECFPALPKTM
jgi:hypothetical protein